MQCLESCTKPHSQSPSDQEHCYITKTACLYIPSSGWVTKCFAPFPHIPHQVSPTTCPGTKEGVQMDRSCKRGEALSLRYFSHPPNVYQTLLWVFCHLIFVGNNYDVVHRSKMTKTLGVSMRPASHSIIQLMSQLRLENLTPNLKINSVVTFLYRNSSMSSCWWRCQLWREKESGDITLSSSARSTFF